MDSGIYIISNTVNDKVYVGQSASLRTRWSNHKSAYRRYKKGKNIRGSFLLWRAFDKHGVDNFKFEVIQHCDKECLDELEISLIKRYKSFGKGGYNMNTGGHQGGVVPKPVYQYDLKGNFIKEWESSRIAATYFGLKSVSNIVSACIGTYAESAGQIWSYKNEDVEYKVEALEKKKRNRYLKMKGKDMSKLFKKVYEYNYNGDFIKSYNSIKDVCEYYNTSYSNMCFILKRGYYPKVGKILIKEDLDKGLGELLILANNS